MSSSCDLVGFGPIRGAHRGPPRALEVSEELPFPELFRFGDAGSFVTIVVLLVFVIWLVLDLCEGPVGISLGRWK